MGCSSAKFLGGSCKVALNQSNHLGMMILRNSFTASAAGCTHACRVQRTPAPFIRNIENTSTAWLSIARISHYHCHNLLDTLICSTGFVTRDDSNILNFLQRNHVAELVYQYWGEIAGTHTHTKKIGWAGKSHHFTVGFDNHLGQPRWIWGWVKTYYHILGINIHQPANLGYLGCQGLNP